MILHRHSSSALWLEGATRSTTPTWIQRRFRSKAPNDANRVWGTNTLGRTMPGEPTHFVVCGGCIQGFRDQTSLADCTRHLPTQPFEQGRHLAKYNTPPPPPPSRSSDCWYSLSWTPRLFCLFKSIHIFAISLAVQVLATMALMKTLGGFSCITSNVRNGLLQYPT